MSNDAAFWDRIARKYAAQPVKNVPAYETTLERTRAYLNPSDHALEVGCGTGSTALTLANAVARITATDISSNMIEIARGKARDQGVDNVDFHPATLDADRFADASFDAVLAFNFLHLVRDVPAAVGRVHRLLKPGGVFISKTVCLGDKWHLRAMIGAMRMVARAPYVGFHGTSQVEAIIAGAGFETVETGDYPPSPPCHFVVARKA